jgi:hypothetical protein
MPKRSTDTAQTKPDLRLVNVEAEVYDLMRAPQTTADRVKRLQAEARALAFEQLEAFERSLHATAALAKEIAEGGDAYPVGARELAGRIATDLPSKAETIAVITSRAGQ